MAAAAIFDSSDSDEEFLGFDSSFRARSTSGDVPDDLSDISFDSVHTEDLTDWSVGSVSSDTESDNGDADSPPVT
jgi:hypothetical protein